MTADFKRQQLKAFEAWLELGGPQREGESPAALQERQRQAQEALPFDLYARDPQDFPLLAQQAPGLKVVSAGGVGLYQAEGYLGLYSFYLRSEAVMGDRETGLEPSAYCDLKVDFTKASHRGSPRWVASLPREVTGDNLEEALLELVGLLKPAPFLYTFPTRPLLYHEGNYVRDEQGVPLVREDGETESSAWGHSPREALEAFMAPPHPLLLKRLSLTAEQHTLLQQRSLISPEPLNRDGRFLPPVDWYQVAKTPW